MAEVLSPQNPPFRVQTASPPMAVSREEPPIDSFTNVRWKQVLPILISIDTLPDGIGTYRPYRGVGDILTLMLPPLSSSGESARCSPGVHGQPGQQLLDKSIDPHSVA